MGTEEDSSLRPFISLGYLGIKRLNFRKTSNTNGNVYCIYIQRELSQMRWAGYVPRMGRTEMHTQFWSANLHDLGIDGRTILKFT